MRAKYENFSPDTTENAERGYAPVRTRTNYGCGLNEAGEVSLCSCSARTRTIA